MFISKLALRSNDTQPSDLGRIQIRVKTVIVIKGLLDRS